MFFALCHGYLASCRPLHGIIDLVKDMNFKVLVVIIGVNASSSAFAGFFDAKEEAAPFKCGREDAVSALVKTIRDDASPMLKSRYAKTASTEQLGQFQASLDAINVQASEVTTVHKTDSSLNCIATITMAIPPELKDIADKVPADYDEFLNHSDATSRNGSLIWKDRTYSIRLADNGTDISIRGTNFYPPMLTLVNAASIATRKDEILKENDPSMVPAAKELYMVEDKELNRIWGTIPKSFRSSMMESQRQWVIAKANTCGSLSRANSPDEAVKNRVDIFKCQADFTKERIQFLTAGQK
ncbi:lysozyme inhibitor LprI family protein [Aeromonas lusitana]|nr:lysozyme inhibitor LprI family protein [Aeromonas lusitana]